MFDLIKVNWRRCSLCLCRPTDTSKTVIIAAFVAVTGVVPQDKRGDNRKWQSERQSLLLSRGSAVSYVISPELNRGAFFSDFTCFRILNAIFSFCPSLITAEKLHSASGGSEEKVPWSQMWCELAFEKVIFKVCCVILDWLRDGQEIMRFGALFFTQNTLFFYCFTSACINILT